MSALSEVGVVSLNPDRWNDWWEVRHDTMRRLARYFRVVWVEPQVSWRPMIANRRDFGAQERSFEVPEGLTIHSAEPWLPISYRFDSLSRFTFARRLNRVRRQMLQNGCEKVVLYVWRPRDYCALDLVEHDLSCYHVEDEYTFSSVDHPTSDRERSLLKRVDQVFIHSPGLLEKKGHLNPLTMPAPNGVDFKAYSTPAPEPDDLKVIPHPRMGYTGRLKRQLDWEILDVVSQRHPEWQFVLIGAVAPHDEAARMVSELSKRANLHFLGERHPSVLCEYVQHFDVCIMPYVDDGYTRYIYPLKLHEYLATGRPIVGSPIRTLEDFSQVVTLARSAEEWEVALQGALSGESCSPDRKRERQDVARRFDWDQLVWKIALTIAGHFGPAYRERVARVRPALPD